MQATIKNFKWMAKTTKKHSSFLFHLLIVYNGEQKFCPVEKISHETSHYLSHF